MITVQKGKEKKREKKQSRPVSCFSIFENQVIFTSSFLAS